MGKVKTEVAKTKGDCVKTAGENKCLKSEVDSLKEEICSLKNQLADVLADVRDKVNSLKPEQERAEEESNGLVDKLMQEINSLKSLSVLKLFLLKILLVKSEASMRMEAKEKVEDQLEKCRSGFERKEEEEYAKLGDNYAKVARENDDEVKEKVEKQKSIHLQEMPQEGAKREVDNRFADLLKEVAELKQCRERKEEECAKLRDDYTRAAREKDEVKEEAESIKQKTIHLQEMLEAAKRETNGRKEEQEMAKVKSDELLKRLEAVAVLLCVFDEDDDANNKKKKKKKKTKKKDCWSRLDWVVGRIEIGALRTQGYNNIWRGYCNLPLYFFLATAFAVFLCTLCFLYA